MYKFLFGCLIVFCLWLSLGRRTFALPISELKSDQIYAFVRHGCTHCDAAQKSLKSKYPNLKIQWRDVASRYNLDLALACAAKFKLDKSHLGTPLFCMGDHYILGWSVETQEQFDEYVIDFLKTSETTE